MSPSSLGEHIAMKGDGRMSWVTIGAKQLDSVFPTSAANS